jgi:hypothetical protein
VEAGTQRNCGGEIYKVALCWGRAERRSRSPLGWWGHRLETMKKDSTRKDFLEFFIIVAERRAPRHGRHPRPLDSPSGSRHGWSGQWWAADTGRGRLTGTFSTP